MRTSEIDLRNDGQELDTTRGEPEGSLKLTIQMPQQEGIPKGMRIMLLDKQNRNRTFQEVDASGQATIPSIFPRANIRYGIYFAGKAIFGSQNLFGSGRNSGA